jgi:hypothetical protein
MTISDLVTNETNFGAGLIITIDSAMDGTYADVTVFDTDGSFVANDTISDAELTSLKADLPNAEFDTY